MFHMYSIVDNINLSFILLSRITQVHVQYQVTLTTIRCLSTCMHKQKSVQLVAVNTGSFAT